jgi:acyl carrier protein
MQRMNERALPAFVRSSIARTCNVDESTLQAGCRLGDIGLDSLSLVSIVSEIESTYGRTFTMSETLDLMNAATVGDLVERLAGAESSASS